MAATHRPLVLAARIVVAVLVLAALFFASTATLYLNVGTAGRSVPAAVVADE